MASVLTFRNGQAQPSLNQQRAPRGSHVTLLPRRTAGNASSLALPLSYSLTWGSFQAQSEKIPIPCLPKRNCFNPRATWLAYGVGTDLVEVFES
jgi:hypothetical protein